MTDRENAIRGLECRSSIAITVRDCENCSYGIQMARRWGCDFIRLTRDALALLKEQEPVEPKMMEFVDKGLTWEKYEVPTCGVCGAMLGDALFCPMCGREVKWE